MIRLRFIFCAITALFLCGCGNKLVELSSNPTCSTTIEGNFITEPVYKYYAPAIVFPEKSRLPDVLGKVVSEDGEGVYVELKASGVFSTRDTVYYKYKDIRAIVDSTRHCKWGSITDKEKAYTSFKVSLQNLDDPDYSPLYFIWNTSSNFSYCAKPGKYEITEIIEVNPEYSQDITYESIPKHIAKFDVLEGKANYIGNFDLRTLDHADSNSFLVPFKKQNSGGNNAAMGQFLFGLAGTAIVAAITAAVNASEGRMNCFVFNVNHDPKYVTMSKSPLVKTPVLPNVNRK